MCPAGLERTCTYTHFIYASGWGAILCVCSLWRSTIYSRCGRNARTSSASQYYGPTHLAYKCKPSAAGSTTHDRFFTRAFQSNYSTTFYCRTVLTQSALNFERGESIRRENVAPYIYSSGSKCSLLVEPPPPLICAHRNGECTLECTMECCGLTGSNKKT